MLSYEDVCPNNHEKTEIEYWLWGLFAVLLFIVIIIKISEKRNKHRF